jgi:hypothetical protein
VEGRARDVSRAAERRLQSSPAFDVSVRVSGRGEGEGGGEGAGDGVPCVWLLSREALSEDDGERVDVDLVVVRVVLVDLGGGPSRRADLRRGEVRERGGERVRGEG